MGQSHETAAQCSLIPDTEASNPATRHIDTLDTLDILRLINDEDGRVAAAVRLELPKITHAVELACTGLRAGGRLIYIGSGTSGRPGVLDASECPPTYGVSPELVQGHIAGGDNALRTPAEGAEDDFGAGVALIRGLAVSPSDTVVGISAGGAAPYVLGGLGQARAMGDKTLGIATNAATPMQPLVDVYIAPLVGPEAIQGSTRMKSGTAQKMVLNMLSTACMVRLGKVYGNMMVDMRATNLKLHRRAQRMLVQITGASPELAEAALEKAAGDVKTAAVILKLGLNRQEAEQRLAKAGGLLRTVLEGLP